MSEEDEGAGGGVIVSTPGAQRAPARQPGKRAPARQPGPSRRSSGIGLLLNRGRQTDVVGDRAGGKERRDSGGGARDANGGLSLFQSSQGVNERSLLPSEMNDVDDVDTLLQSLRAETQAHDNKRHLHRSDVDRGSAKDLLAGFTSRGSLTLNGRNSSRLSCGSACGSRGSLTGLFGISRNSGDDSSFGRNSGASPSHALSPGSKKSRRLRPEEIEAARPWFARMVSPDSRLAVRWDGAMVALVIISCVLAPLQVAWDDEFEALGRGAYLSFVVFSVAIDVTFLFDICLNFRTGVKVDGVLVMEPTVVASNYVRGWFLTDLLSSIPLDFAAGGFKTFKVLRVLKLLRLIRLSRYLDSLAAVTHFNPSKLRLSKLLFILLLLWHWIGCLWWYIGSLPPSEAGDTIVQESCLVDDCRQQWGATEALRASRFSSKYLFALWWSVGVSTGMVDGVAAPENDAQMLFTTCVIVFGVATNAVMISHMTSTLANIDATAVQRRQKLDTLNQYLRIRRVPTGLRQRISAYYEYLWSRNHTLDDKEMLGEMPSSLQLQLALVLNRALFTKVPLFREMETGCIVAFVHHLRPFIALPGLLLVKQGTKAAALCFVNRGRLEMLKDDAYFDTLVDNDFFGEHSVLYDTVSPVAVRACVHCDLMYLHKSAFDRVMRMFPNVRAIVTQHADMLRSQREQMAKQVKAAAAAKMAAVRLAEMHKQSKSGGGDTGICVAGQRARGAIRRGSTALRRSLGPTPVAPRSPQRAAGSQGGAGPPATATGNLEAVVNCAQ